MNLLIVENDVVVSKVWKKTFGKRFNVFQVYHAPEAIGMLQNTSIDLVILDLRLNGPTPSGLEVYNYIRQNMQSDIPIAFITGLEDNVDLYKQAELATEIDRTNSLFTVLVKKPIRIRDLAKILDGMVKKDLDLTSTLV
jgi:CheY-like chemotaxis protein